MSTELMTQLVILATAIVGLYKAATYKPKQMPASSMESRPGPAAMVFSGLLAYVGIFAFILVMPAFIWAFTWITSNISTSTRKASEIAYSIPHQISSSPTNAELLLVAASQVPYSSARADALVRVIDYSLDSGEEKLAVIAASSIPFDNVRANELKKIMDRILKSKPKNKLDSSVQPTAKPAAN